MRAARKSRSLRLHVVADVRADAALRRLTIQVRPRDGYLSTRPPLTNAARESHWHARTSLHFHVTRWARWQCQARWACSSDPQSLSSSTRPCSRSPTTPQKCSLRPISPGYDSQGVRFNVYQSSFYPTRKPQGP